MIIVFSYVILLQEHVKAIKVHVNLIATKQTVLLTLLLLVPKIVFVEGNLPADNYVALTYLLVSIVAPELKVIKYPHHTNIVLIATICAHIIVTLIQFFLNFCFEMCFWHVYACEIIKEQ